MLVHPILVVCPHAFRWQLCPNMYHVYSISILCNEVVSWTATYVICVSSSSCCLYFPSYYWILEFDTSRFISKLSNSIDSFYVKYKQVYYVYTYITNQQMHTDKICFIIYYYSLICFGCWSIFHQYAFVGLLHKCKYCTNVEHVNICYMVCISLFIILTLLL
jgi:hypothetical protein